MVYFVLIEINDFVPNQEVADNAAAVKARNSTAELAIYQLQRLVTIHGDQQGMCELWLIFELVQAGRARIEHSPVLAVLPENSTDAGVDTCDNI